MIGRTADAVQYLRKSLLEILMQLLLCFRGLEHPSPIAGLPSGF
jgi:hypothetical protein